MDLVTTSDRHWRAASQSSDAAAVQRAGTTPAASGLNTILAVRDHAPAEIDVLDAEIRALKERLAYACARKRLLEQLLAVIHQADAGWPSPCTPMTVVK
jgi:hypothetical protein